VANNLADTEITVRTSIAPRSWRSFHRRVSRPAGPHAGRIEIHNQESEIDQVPDLQNEFYEITLAAASFIATGTTTSKS
jgi:hypothetical protein